MKRKISQLFFCLLLAASALAQSDSQRSTACAGCHAQAKTQPSTSMGRALESVEECKILIDRPLLTGTVAGYTYRIERKGNQSSYSVSDGTNIITVPIRWAMGASSAIGQTYILEKDGELLESRVSYFRDLGGLGPTMGAQNSVPADLNEAVGRPMSHDDKLRCFGCHSTKSATGRQLTLEKLRPGVQCDHCHKDADTHLVAMLQTPETATASAKPRLLTADQASNFCGQCHRTWAEIASQANPSIANIRFQPYRLTGSKCYDADDPRISCVACHDPHHEVSTAVTDYDSKCQACHGGGKPGAKYCPVSKSKCASCHMPKLELPGAHYKFSDHRIRIVKPDEPYPG